MQALKIDDVTAGMVLVADGGFTCMAEGPKVVGEDQDGLFVPCDCGRHYLEAQVVDPPGILIGFKTADQAVHRV